MTIKLAARTAMAIYGSMACLAEHVALRNSIEAVELSAYSYRPRRFMQIKYSSSRKLGRLRDV